MNLIQRGLRFCTNLGKFGVDNIIKGQKIKFGYLRYAYNPVVQSKGQTRRLNRGIRRNKLSFLIVLIGEDDTETKKSVAAQRLGPNRILLAEDLMTANKVVEGAKEDYILFLPMGNRIDDAYLAAVSLKLQNKQTGRPKLIYTDSKDFEGNYYFKSNYGPDSLDAQNYIGEIFLVETSAFEKTDGFLYPDVKKGMYDFLLRLTKEAKEDITKEGDILHITSPLDCYGKFELEVSPYSYEIENHPKVSILIPNKDQADTLKTCIDSIIERSSYDNYEIVIIENNSVEEKTFQYYDSISSDVISVVKCVTKWNYSYINNYGLKYIKGDYVIFLNNDTEVISEDWIEQMLFFAKRKDVGAVGIKLLYPDHTIQHGGVILGIRGIAGHAFLGADETEKGYMNRLVTVSNVSAVTAACMMVPAEVLKKVKGFDEGFAVAFNDVDLCLRIKKAGYRIVMNPFAKLYHYESKSRGSDEQNQEKLKRFNAECDRFGTIWYEQLMNVDPYYNRNLTMEADDFSYADIYRG